MDGAGVYMTRRWVAAGEECKSRILRWFFVEMFGGGVPKMYGKQKKRSHEAHATLPELTSKKTLRPVTHKGLARGAGRLRTLLELGQQGLRKVFCR